MKRERKESGFLSSVVLASVIFGLLLAVGLFVPSLQPLALQAGTVLSIGIILVGLGVVLYVAWRIATFPARSRKAAAARQRANRSPASLTGPRFPDSPVGV